jgi:DNA-binding transcriptional ArsR family regulator
MARAATSSDVFNAIAEPQRRAILEFIAGDERSVSEIVDALELAQPSVSKHLRVLRDVGVVRARRDGRQVLYRTNAAALRPLHEWAGLFERYWRNQLSRIKERAERK